MFMPSPIYELVHNYIEKLKEPLNYIKLNSIFLLELIEQKEKGRRGKLRLKKMASSLVPVCLTLVWQRREEEERNLRDGFAPSLL
jgi:hypothetical protein